MLPQWHDWLEPAFRLMLDASLRASVVAIGVGLVLVAARARSGSLRHAAWCAVLAAMLLMPVLPRYAPAIAIPVPMPAPEVAVPADSLTLLAEPPTSAQADTPPGASSALRGQALSGARARLAVEPQPAIWPLALLALYLSGALFLFARLAAGWWAMRHIVRHSSAVLTPQGPAVPARRVVAESPALATPVTVGAIRPRILLPTAWRSWPNEKLRAVLAHEGAHVARRDTLVALVARVNVCLFWFHPLAWWLERTIAAAAEHACDDAGARAIGETRRYAEVLLDMAEAARRAGGRIAWQGVGVHGSGLLGQRIDRILRGDFIREVSMTRKILVAIGSAVTIFVVVACHEQRPAPPPLKPDERAVAEAAKRKADGELYKAARAMSAPQVAQLHDRWKQNPEDVVALRQLLMFYSAASVEAPGANGKWVAPCTLVIPERDCVSGRRELISWLVEHHPESQAAGEFGALIFTTSLDPLPDPAGYEQVKKLWLEHASRPDVDVAVLGHAAAFFRVPDKPLAERMLLRAQSIEPGTHAWSAALGELYALIIVGSNASMPMGVVRSVNLADAHGTYAEQVRRRLAESTDVEMLASAGAGLVQRTGLVSERLDFDPVPLGKSYLERAVQIDPQQPRARANLVWLQTRDRNTRLRALLKGVAPGKERETIARLPDADRFAYLPWLAQTAFMRGDYLKNSKHDEPGMKAAWHEARRYAGDLLTLAPKLRDDPGYATAIYYGNTVLGLVTYREGGDTQVAVRYAIEASKAPANEELQYGSTFELLRLLQYLARAGERDTVAECLDRMAGVDKLNGERLRRAAADIRRGVMPEYWDI